jgi:hypothetical protein
MVVGNSQRKGMRLAPAIGNIAGVVCQFEKPKISLAIGSSFKIDVRALLGALSCLRPGIPFGFSEAN